MGVEIKSGGCSYSGEPQYPHLPIISKWLFQNVPTVPELMQRFMFMCMFPLAQFPDPATQCRDQLATNANFLARRAGLKENMHFKVLPEGTHALRMAFATAGAFHRYNAVANRHNLAVRQSGTDRLPEACNDPSLARKEPPASVSFLPGGYIEALPPAARFIPLTSGQEKAVRPSEGNSANESPIRPKARILAFKPRMS